VLKSHAVRGAWETYSHRVWYTSSLSTDEDALGRFGGTRLIVAKFVPLYTYAHDLALVYVQALRLGRIEQFVSRGCLGARKPEICAFVGVARWRKPGRWVERVGVRMKGRKRGGGRGERRTTRMDGGGRRVESTCLRKNQRTL